MQTLNMPLLYPNPVTEALNIVLPDVPEIPVQLRLFHLNGHLVQEATLAEQTGQISVAALPAGVYVLQIIGTDGAPVAVERVVKQ